MSSFKDGGKPKKRVIFVEAPKKVTTIKRYLDAKTNTEIPESELKNRKVVGYNYTGREDLDKAISEEILESLSAGASYEDFSDYMQHNYGLNLSNNQLLKSRYDSIYNTRGEDFNREMESFSEELYGSSLVKNLAEAAKDFLKDPIYENTKVEEVKKETVDSTFIKEAEKAARASLEIDGIPAEIIPFYGEEDFDKITKKYNKNTLKNTDVILLGHAGSKIAGVKNEVWNSYLKENMDKDSTCYGGICGGDVMAADFKDAPNFTGTVRNKWIGIPEYKSFKGKGSFDDIFFSNVEDESDQVTAIKPKYGREFANFQKNPELVPNVKDEFGRIVRSSRLVEIPTQILFPQQIEPAPQIPTLRTQVRMQDGGNPQNNTMKNTKFPTLSKFLYQQGGYGTGYGEFQGDAGRLLRDIMMGTTASGMFEQQTGDYSKVSTADYLKSKGYSEPYAKTDWLGNKTMYVKDSAGNEVKVKDFEKEVEAYNKSKASEFKSNQEQFNKFLPITQNLAGLFDLQQREQDEIANKKLTVQDFPTSTSSYAPVGFAQDGGGMQSTQTTMPSLQAIMKGLPRGMSKKHKEMVKSNADKELFALQQTMGYRDDSPFRNLPEQDFYTDTINMDNVSTPLAAITDNGMAKILPPNSGTHIFKGAKVVKEIPAIAQDGMLAEDDNTEMIMGVIEILRQIEDPENRQEVAMKKLEELVSEGIEVDQEAFMEAVMEDEEEGDDDIETMKNGGIPNRYKKAGFTRVGQKKKSTRQGKKWMVLAKKGNKYKIVHGGAAGMSDYTKHKDKDRRDRFWDRMGGKNSAKTRDPFSPLMWHKKFGTW